jgi:RNA polymerase sigma-70 factor (ECF subfamily)
VEDISQNVFISVQRRLGEFRKTEKKDTFRGWLYTITRNEIINFFRVQAKRHTAKGGSDNLRLMDQFPAEPLSGSSVNQTAVDPVLKQAFEMIRGEFDERTWKIYTRFKIDNVPAKEVAVEFGTTDGNVRLIAFRVRKRISTDFGGLVEFPE